MSKSMVSLLEKLLQRDPKQRLVDIAVIKSHPFFGSIDWNIICETQHTPPKDEMDEILKIVRLQTQPQSSTEYNNLIPTWVAPVHSDYLAGMTIVDNSQFIYVVQAAENIH